MEGYGEEEKKKSRGGEEGSPIQIILRESVGSGILAGFQGCLRCRKRRDGMVGEGRDGLITLITMFYRDSSSPIL